MGRHGNVILLAMLSELLSKPLAQFRPEPLQLLKRRRVFESDGAGLERVVGMLVGGDTLGLAFSGSLPPLFDPLEKQRVGTRVLRHWEGTASEQESGQRGKVNNKRRAETWPRCKVEQ